jgi:molybdopterin converting factor small subunit
MARVKLYGKAKELAGREELDVSLEKPTTIRELIDKISEGRPEASSKAVKAVLVNGRNCIFSDGLETLVNEGDLVEILPFISGG